VAQYCYTLAHQSYFFSSTFSQNFTSWSPFSAMRGLFCYERPQSYVL